MRIDNFFCKVFLKIESDDIKGAFLKNVSLKLDGEFDKFLFLEDDLLTIELRKNKEYDSNKIEDKDDGFLFYPYFLEIDLKEEDEEAVYLSTLIDILGILNEMHIKYVSACCFEDLLPKSL